MNWLAHVFLSEPDVEFRLGNLLADLVKRPDRAGMPARFLVGIRQHQAIDAFTDAHPIVHRSRARIRTGIPHTNGILLDVFYDHFLAIDWDLYASEPFDSFLTRLYADIRAHSIPLPADAQGALNHILADDRLGSYRTVEGIEATLRRLSKRLELRFGRDLALDRGVSELVGHFDELRADFAEFFPQLAIHIARTSEHLER